MNILQKMASFFVQRLTPRDPNGWYPSGALTDSGETVSAETVLGISSVWACVNLIAGTISSLPLMVYRTAKDGSRTVAGDHPLYRLMHDSPNFDQTAVDFWDFVAASIELWGNAYAKIEREGARVVAVVPINPALVTVRRKANGDLEYRWTEDGRTNTETDKTVLHIRGPGGNPLGGLSTLHNARNTFALARAQDKAAGALFKNGLRPSGALKFKAWLTPEQRAIADKELIDKIGAGNTGKPIRLEGDTDWVPFTINPDDAQMLESRTFSVEEICRFFGVPPFMVGQTTKSTSWGTGLEQQTLGFLKFTLRRRLKRIEQALEKQLLTPVERAQGIIIEFNLEGLLRADSGGRATFYQQMTSIGAMTINEVRRLENLPPVDGGDEPRMQMQNVPITEAGKQPASLPAPADDEEQDA